MRHIFLFLVPWVLALAVAGPLVVLTTVKDHRTYFKLIVTSSFLYLAAFVGNVASPGLNALIAGEFHSDLGPVGSLEWILISTVFYMVIMWALSRSVRFKSGMSMIVYVLLSSLIYGIAFEAFMKWF